MAARPQLRPTQRSDRVRCGSRALDGLRERERAVWAGYGHFRELALLALRDRTGAEAEQYDRGQQCGDVRVGNGAEGFFVAGVYARLR